MRFVRTHYLEETTATLTFFLLQQPILLSFYYSLCLLTLFIIGGGRVMFISELSGFWHPWPSKKWLLQCCFLLWSQWWFFRLWRWGNAFEVLVISKARVVVENVHRKFSIVWTGRVQVQCRTLSLELDQVGWGHWDEQEGWIWGVFWQEKPSCKW